jgi:four helix bundle protein
MKKKTPNAQHRTPNIEWMGVREDEPPYGNTAETFNVQRPTFNVQKADRDARFDLENRLLEFTARLVKLVEALPASRAGNHVAGQLLRCGTSPFANHGEVQAAESRKDFVHKLGICLKELREIKRWIRLIVRVELLSTKRVRELLIETEELIMIFSASIRTAEKNAK